MRIYLDNCCYNRPYDDQTSVPINLETRAKLVIQEMVRQGIHELVSSETLEYEIDASPYEEQSTAIRKFIQTYASLYVGAKRYEEVINLAKTIEETGVKYYDARHVASAIIAKCNYFITVDKRLLKYQTDEIRLVNPIEFISETEEI